MCLRALGLRRVRMVRTLAEQQKGLEHRVAERCWKPLQVSSPCCSLFCLVLLWFKMRDQASLGKIVGSSTVRRWVQPAIIHAQPAGGTPPVPKSSIF